MKFWFYAESMKVSKINNPLNLIPQIDNFEKTEGFCFINKSFLLVSPAFFAQECAVFAEQMAICNFSVSCAASLPQNRNPEEPFVIIEADGSPKPENDAASVPASRQDESYSIEIKKEGVFIKAGQKAGAFYALQTLRQLLMTAANEADKFAELAATNEEIFESPEDYEMEQDADTYGLKLCCCKITDQPNFEWRGFMLDTVRHYFSVRFIKKLLDIAALHKLNRFHWHLTDDQGWRIPVEDYPNLIKIGSVQPDPRHQMRDTIVKKDEFYSIEQIKEVIEYAAARHILVVPEIETPGHASAILAAYPELGCYGAFYQVEGRYGVFDDVLCAGNDEIFNLIDSALKTVAGVFPGPYLHIGGDECPHVRWEMCPKCQNRMKNLGLSSANQLQSWITTEVCALVKKYNKIPIGWDEILDNSDKFSLNEEAVVMSWRGTEGGINAAKLNHKVIMCPQTAGCYLDFPHLQNAEEPGLHNFATVKMSYSYSPIPEDFPKENEGFVLGGQGNLWTELVTSPRWAEYMMFPRLCAMAESLWLNPAKKDFENFAKRLKAHKERLDNLDVLYYKGKLE